MNFALSKANFWEFGVKFVLLVWLCFIPFENSIYQVSTILIILLALFHAIIYKNGAVFVQNLKQTKALTFFFCLIILSMVIANLLNPELLHKKSWRNIAIFLTRYAPVFIALAYFYKMKFFSKQELVLFLLCGTSIVLISAIYQMITHFDLVTNTKVWNDKKSGLTGLLDNRNRLGLVMGVGAIFSLLLSEKRPRLGVILFLAHVFVLVFTYSRSSWVGVGAALLLYMIYNFKKHPKFITLFLLLSICVVLGIYFSSKGVQIRFDNLLAGHTSHRDKIWEFSISQIQNAPIFGHGVFSWVNIAKPKKLVKFIMVHNAELEILLFTGIFGLLAWIGAFFTALKDIFTSRNFAYFYIIVYFFIVVQFDFSLFDSKRLLSYLCICLFLIYADRFRETSA